MQRNQHEGSIVKLYKNHPDLSIYLDNPGSLMHGLGETFDYLNIGLVAIMFQLLWDIAGCESFKE